MDAIIHAAVRRAIAHRGSQRALARDLGISAAAVGQWLHEKAAARGVPPKQCVRIERLTGVSRKELRAHDWHEIWPELEDLEPKPAQVLAAREPAAINSEAVEAANV